MAKAPGRAALRISDIAAPIDVIRDGASANKKHARLSPPLRKPSEGDLRIMHEVSEDLRTALVPDRIAEAVARQLEPLVAHRIRVLLQQRLANDLRALLRKHARNRFGDVDASDVLNETLADALTADAAEALSNQFPSALRERLPVAIRAATTRSAFAQRVGGAGIADLAERLSAVAETTIRHRIAGTLRSIVRLRLGELARDDARELLRAAAASGDGTRASADQIALVADGIERAVHDRVVHGIIERFRALVASSLHHATGERLGDGLHRTLALADNAGQAHKPLDHAGQEKPARDGLAERLEGPIARCIRARLMDGLRDRVEATCRDNIDDVLRERLLGATRVAIAEQRGADAVDGARLADVITYELAEVLRARICDGIRARTAEAVRMRLADAIREGVGRAHVD